MMRGSSSDGRDSSAAAGAALARPERVWRSASFGIVAAQLAGERRTAAAGSRLGHGRGVGLLDGADAHAGRAGRVVGQVEVLAQREARVLGRHEDAAQVAVALEDDAEHVVGLALQPLRARPQESDRGAARVLARQALDDDAQPVGAPLAPQVIDHLHRRRRCPRRPGRPGSRSACRWRRGRVRRTSGRSAGAIRISVSSDCWRTGPSDHRAQLSFEPALEGRDPSAQTSSGTVGPISRSVQWPRRSLTSWPSWSMP